MTSPLETAENPERLQRVVIEPLTRVEGHGKVTLLRDDQGHIHQARLHIAEFRGFEKFIQGRPYWELPVLVQRLCGICPVSHHLAAAKATDMLVGSTLTPTAEKIRRLMHYGQTLQSHALHFFHLCSPDLLFGFDDEVRHRNIVGVIEDHPEIAKQGVLLRKYGQEVIRLTAGKRVHGTGAIPGGVNKSLNREERDYLLADIGQMLEWAQGAVELVKKVFFEHLDYHLEFGTIDSNMMSMVAADGSFDIYHGGLRARDPAGATIFDHADYTRYEDFLKEGVKNWSYMKFPFIATLGLDNGWYRVGPLARVNNCDRFTTPLAEQARAEFMAVGEGRPVVLPARAAASAAEEKADKGHHGVFSGAAVGLPNGEIVAGHNSPLMHASSALVLNAIKNLAKIPEHLDLISPTVIESIGTLRKDLLGLGSISLNLEDTLIALSISATTNPIAHQAMQQIPNPSGC